jgi:hypothetical protein
MPTVEILMEIGTKLSQMIWVKTYKTLAVNWHKLIHLTELLIFGMVVLFGSVDIFL